MFIKKGPPGVEVFFQSYQLFRLAHSMQAVLPRVLVILEIEARYENERRLHPYLSLVVSEIMNYQSESQILDFDGYEIKPKGDGVAEYIWEPQRKVSGWYSSHTRTGDVAYRRKIEEVP